MRNNGFRRRSRRRPLAGRDASRAGRDENTPGRAFLEAEDYHQEYYRKNRSDTGFTGTDRRDRFWKSLAGGEKKSRNAVPPGLQGRSYAKPDEETLGEVTPLQYDVTQRDGTEPPFRNEYWDNKRDGSMWTSCPASRFSAP
jgi:peptide methionine sulfoxide reductase msrA/msrB